MKLNLPILLLLLGLNLAVSPLRAEEHPFFYPDAATTETYVVTVTNQGSAPATNVRITCTLEPNQEYVSSSGDSTGTARGATVTFEPFASIPPKGKATWRIVVRNVKAGDVRFKVSMMTDQLTRPVEETEATNVYE